MNYSYNCIEELIVIIYLLQKDFHHTTPGEDVIMNKIYIQLGNSK